MNEKTQELIPSAAGRRGGLGLTLLMLIVFGLPYGCLSVQSILAGGDSLALALFAAAGCFLLFAVGYLDLHGVADLGWCSIPVLVTVEAALEFVYIPAWRFATGSEQVTAGYVHAMMLSLIGLMSFWTGSLLFLRKRRINFVPCSRLTPKRLIVCSGTMFLVGATAKVLIWKAGLFSYVADAALRESALPFMGELVFCENLLSVALIIAAIEVLGKRSRNPLMRLLFWASLVFSIAFGVISGMKGEILFPIIYVAFVYFIANRRIHWVVLLFPLLPVLIYPFGNAYRANLNKIPRVEATTLEGLEKIMQKSFLDVVDKPVSTAETSSEGLDATTSRLSLLSYVNDIVSLPSFSILQGNERIWQAPFYPLIPRLIWRNKPVLNKAVRLSIALGRPASTASALTPIGDLYSLYGGLGVGIGMLAYGICIQLYMNWVTRSVISERGLFCYVSMIMPLVNLELDVVTSIATIVQLSLITGIMAFIVYGRSVNPEPAQTGAGLFLEGDIR